MSAVPEVENGNTYNGCIPCRENTSGTKDAGEVQLRAYEKAGFKIIKSLPKPEMFEGEKVDCWLMELAL